MLTLVNCLIFAALLPLASFVGLIFLGKKLGRAAGPVATALIFGSLALSVMATIQWVAKPEYNAPHYVEVVSWNWIPLSAPAVGGAGGAAAHEGGGIAFGLLIDSLTIAMFTMVTLVSALVHLFSIAYMLRDPKYPRFFAYLGLFCFSMLGLVLSNSLIQMFVFWELVGISSYLLIGFWNENRAPARASLKAAVVNRIGDALFLVGIGVLAMHVGASNLSLYDGAGNPQLPSAVVSAAQSELLNAHPQSILEDFSRLAVASDAKSILFYNFGGSFLGLSWLTWVGLCLLGGAAAKSAQFPFHVWLPDAMAGPTPVSALIHAATMVAAGVFLMARVYPLLTMDVRLVMALVGCVTLAVGGLIAVVQTDLKKVLAYSTISQLGYMFLFLGSGGYVAGLLHLFTHAFFKACLFLAAGSVLSNVHHVTDMRRMGGLWRKLPITAGAFLAASLALAATPWFSGAISKDLGMAGVYAYAHQLSLGGGGHAKYAMTLFWVPVIGSYLSAFYIGRAFWLTFGGKSRDEDLAEHAHEHALMTLPLILLAFLSVGVWFSPTFGAASLISKSLPPGVPAQRVDEVQAGMISPWLAYAFVAGAAAVLLYRSGMGLAERMRKWPGVNLVYAWLREKMFFDDLYEGVLIPATLVVSGGLGLVDKYVVDFTVNLVGWAVRGLSRLSGAMDDRVIDGAVRGFAGVAAGTGRLVLRPQSGKVRTYLLVVMGAMAVAAVGAVAWWMG